jgi:CMP-N,N'-diacetyllegionaminic acid synthase
MINGYKILVIIPARGGSKGVKLKNIRKVGGFPLLALVAKVVKQIPIIDKTIVSTDHTEIVNVAINSGLEVPFLRPKSLSGDQISDIDVLTHTLLEAETYFSTIYDIIVMLQPTSPLRTPKHIVDAINLLINESADSVWTISETDSKGHPYKQLIINDGKIDYYDIAASKIIARQQLLPTYHKNGVAYVMTRDCILNQKSIKGNKCCSLLINEPVVNIDTEFDIEYAEYLYKKLNY